MFDLFYILPLYLQDQVWYSVAREIFFGRKFLSWFLLFPSPFFLSENDNLSVKDGITLWLVIEKSL